MTKNLLLSLAVVSAACVGRSDAPALVIERSHVSMGSPVTLTALTADDAAALSAFGAVFDEFDRLDRLMSVWHRGSDVARLNMSAGGPEIEISPEVAGVLRMAREVSTWTNGKFDVTFGALADVWRFDHDRDNRVPEDAEIRRRLPLIDYQGIELSADGRRARLARAGMRVHLGGIGKGYAVDRAVDILRGRGLRDFMIQSGGDLYVAGRRGDRPWRVGIQDPRGVPGTLIASLDLTDSTFSTSGDYERFFIRDGRRHHHLLDPDTGQPAAGCRSVTIAAPRALLADALSTGVFIAGPVEGMALIERLPDVEGVIVTAANEVLVSSGLRGRFAASAPPTAGP